jgi:AraC-like DNA-binding protein
MNRVVSSPSVTFGEATYNPKGSCGPRTQGDFQLVAVIRGSALVHVADGSIAIRMNSVALMRPGLREHFRFDTVQPSHHTWCAVHPSAVDQGFLGRISLLPQVLPLSDRLQSLISMGLDLSTGEYPAEGLISSLGLACLAAFEYEASSGGAERRPEALQSAIHLLDRRLAEPWTVEKLAGEVGISTQHLIRLFNQFVGQTPARYMWNVRTRRGVSLLRETGLPIQQIAEQVGFASPFHFARLVRQSYGINPRAIRAAAWGRKEPEPKNHEPE